MNQPPKKHITNSGEVMYFLQKELHIDKQIVDTNIIISQYLKKHLFFMQLCLMGEMVKAGQHIQQTLHSACNNKINFTAGNIKELSENRKKCEKCIIPVKIQKLLKRGVTKEYTHVPHDFISTAFIREKKTETQRTI